MEDRAQLLIDILLDDTAEIGERDDAAMDLADYQELRVLEALTKIVSKYGTEDMIINSCAESIAAIYAALNYFDESSFKKMVPYAQSIIFHTLLFQKPELIPPVLKNELIKKYNMEEYLQLLDTLSDTTAPEDKRLLAVERLRQDTNSSPCDVLTKIASDPCEPEQLIKSCAEALAEIYGAYREFDEATFKELTPIAQKVIFHYIITQKPGLISLALIRKLAKELNYEVKWPGWQS